MAPACPVLTNTWVVHMIQWMVAFMACFHKCVAYIMFVTLLQYLIKSHHHKIMSESFLLNCTVSCMLHLHALCLSFCNFCTKSVRIRGKIIKRPITFYFAEFFSTNANEGPKSQMNVNHTQVVLMMSEEEKWQQQQDPSWKETQCQECDDWYVCSSSTRVKKQLSSNLNQNNKVLIHRSSDC